MGVLNGKVALVTGASKGIGAGIAKGLAAADASVVVNYASSKQGADRVVSAIVAHGGKAMSRKNDDVQQLFAEAAQEFGGLDVLVNNAGVAVVDGRNWYELISEVSYPKQPRIHP